MADDPLPHRAKTKWLWILILALLLLVAIAFWFNPMGGVEPEDVVDESVSAATDSPVATFTPAPAGPAVDVTLPTDELTALPAPTAAPGAETGATGSATDAAP